MSTGRAERIQGLRELADWLEAHPEVPVPYVGRVNAFAQGATTAEKMADLRHIGALLGAEPRQSGPHIEVPGAVFSGGVSYSVLVCDALLVDFPESGAPHVCRACGQPHALAAEDITRGEEVGAEDEGPAAPTSAWTPPADDGRPLPRLLGLTPIPDPALVDEQVWVSTERKGIDFHAVTADSQRAGCGRSTHTGRRLPRREAEAFARPCPRCYPGGTS